MEKLPFSAYDFFGNLSAGFIMLVGAAAAFTDTDEWRTTPSLISGLILVIVAYIAGQIIAHLAAFLLERLLVRRVLKTPTHNLFAPQRAGFWPLVLPGYFGPLPRAQREAVLQRATDEAGIMQAGEGLFFHCWGRVKRDPVVAARLSTFLNLYGFCRNMSLTLAAVAVMLGIGMLLGTARTGDIVTPTWWAVASAGLSVGLLYRYLKFFRHYSIEVFVSYVSETG